MLTNLAPIPFWTDYRTSFLFWVNLFSFRLSVSRAIQSSLPPQPSIKHTPGNRFLTLVHFSSWSVDVLIRSERGNGLKSGPRWDDDRSGPLGCEVPLGSLSVQVSRNTYIVALPILRSFESLNPSHFLHLHLIYPWLPSTATHSAPRLNQPYLTNSSR
jgi:hypothetical protein